MKRTRETNVSGSTRQLLRRVEAKIRQRRSEPVTHSICRFQAISRTMQRPGRDLIGLPAIGGPH